ncbi:adenosylcobalamin-dependent ribonucleoside-diphosphate reductase [archaeon]|jgi:ribonucleoside-diphosphate reductase alpha chain|nr:adenosylcobalamin-dependent ribonucleoside-diphosphate reductase [archaeon]MBT4397164.1 adenosylcobalamin-dependent ribonucleoside-diphosphate reductase [archaeon]MBT4441530.1 adenosylcobalamin-dependent ribonucleoside-diphosphate reductase [archaeon]
MFSKIKKRSGRIVRFQRSKVKDSILKAMKDIDHVDAHTAEEVTKEIIRRLNAKFEKITPTVEDIQDIVEDALISYDLADLAKEYILYRARHKDLQDMKRLIGIRKDELELTVNAITVLEKRYLLRNKKGEIKESPKQMFQRVAKHAASIEKVKLKKKFESEFYGIMSNLEFLPNTPCLVNSNTKLGQLSACFVLPMDDSIESIYSTLKTSASIFQSGGGVGYSFSNLRPKGSIIESINRFSSGPVSFMEIFDKSSEVIKQGGIRRGASLGVLRVDHPDILDFISSKPKLKNFNISVAVTNDFMNKVIANESYYLTDHKNKRIRKIRARDVFEMICSNAWSNGDPGLIFIDEINKKNTLKKLGRIKTTNPCGETTLLDNESCVLGSINLSKMVRNGRVDWVKLNKTSRLGVRFLDNLIDANKYPSKEIEIITKANRKIGLGVMGWADMLIELGVKYDSYNALELAKKVMKFIKEKAEDESKRIGREKGVFKNYKKSNLKTRRRNATLFAIAPTGSISLIANCSSGIEPLFGLSYVRNTLQTKLFEVNESFKQQLRFYGLYSKDLILNVAKQGSIKKIDLPRELKSLYVTAFDIKPEWHVKMQSTFQKYVDNSVSKTVNLPKNATVEDIKKIFVQAYRLKCKGITLYRYGSQDKQVLYLGEKKEPTKVCSEYSGGCLIRNCNF